MAKGLSPLIATIVLIGITITVGATISVFVSNIVTRTSTSTTTCGSNANYILESAEYNKAGDSVLVIRLTNKNKEQLYGFGVELQNGTDIRSFSDGAPEISLSPAVTSSNPLAQEQSALVKVNLSLHTAFAATMGYAKVTNKACADVSAALNAVSKF
ncbi:MAG: hypothetical protein HY367_04555 [Candidatus Aenigmarchaeota archaeon]|nr:hypothetical protein [Candidatus Aenigmarchaeota archaeon]